MRYASILVSELHRSARRSEAGAREVPGFARVISRADDFAVTRADCGGRRHGRECRVDSVILNLVRVLTCYKMDNHKRRYLDLMHHINSYNFEFIVIFKNCLLLK